MFFWFVCYLVVVWLISASDESCPELPSVENGIIVIKEVEGQILGTCLCIKGYHLVGEKNLFCNASVEWNAPVPTCHLGHCPDPVLVNGEPSSLGPVNVNDKITFKCNEDYILKGSNWSQCLDNHTWMPPLPVCKSRDCGPPGNPAHGYFEGRDFNSGSTITYHCEDKYHLVGTRNQQCVDGEWSSALPICELIQEAPKPIPRTAFEKALFAFQENKELCKAIENFVQTLKENDLTMEELKYSLEKKKAELEAKMLS
ncbi:C4b-binding protein beta chain [Enhydra lutris kenyoni]|uniref:C4b-binding protein beta chain n=1 Tax=Enhydra lutris kenyoni TaxID=391180 RepID=A0A2Y9JUB6_ENHLU|nr:C4b-binding protein beta chain [Enhydra lutris kenyoni]